MHSLSLQVGKFEAFSKKSLKSIRNIPKSSAFHPKFAPVDTNDPRYYLEDPCKSIHVWAKESDNA
jgi:hypothetical protein